METPPDNAAPAPEGAPGCEGQATPDKTPGIFGWNELLTRDGAASTAFYTELLGWTAEEMPMPTGTYTIFKSGDRPVGGMMNLPPEAAEAPEMWMGYINVADLEAAVAKARELEATICKEITEIPMMGRFAIVTDPRGATFGLWEFA